MIRMHDSDLLNHSAFPACVSMRSCSRTCGVFMVSPGCSSSVDHSVDEPVLHCRAAMHSVMKSFSRNFMEALIQRSQGRKQFSLLAIGGQHRGAVWLEFGGEEGRYETKKFWSDPFRFLWGAGSNPNWTGCSTEF